MPTDSSKIKSTADEEERLRELLKLKRDRRKMQDQKGADSSKDAENGIPIPKKQEKFENSNLESSKSGSVSISKEKDNDADKEGNKDKGNDSQKANEGNSNTGNKETAPNGNKPRRRRRRGGRRRNRNRDRRRGGKFGRENDMNNFPHGGPGGHEGDRWYRGGDPRDYYGGPSYRGPPRPSYYYDDRGYNGGGHGGGGYGPPPDYRGGYGGRYDRMGDDYYHGRRRDDYYWGDEGRYRDGRYGRDSRRHSRSRSRSRSRSLSRSSRSRSPSNSSSASYSPSRSPSRSRSNSRSVSLDRSGKERSSNEKKNDKDRESEKERKEDRRRSRSRSRSADKNNGADKNKRKKTDVDYDRAKDRDKERSRDRNRRRHRSRSRSKSVDHSHDQEKKNAEERSPKDKTKISEKEKADAAITKDQRTIFVSQLVMRADERDIRRFFKRKGGCKVNDVILLRDRRTGRHKGCAYVELGRLEDVPSAVDFNGTVPDFQRFPILVRASEAEKNYDDNGKISSDGVTSDGHSGSTPSDPNSSMTNSSNISTIAAALSAKSEMNRRIEAQNIYVGSIDRCVTQAQLYAVFSQFGKLENVGLQMDPTTGMSRGFAFLSFPDAKDANLAIQTMSGQKLAGRPLKTGWANQASTPAVEYVTSEEFPEDSAARIQNAHLVLTQLTGSGLMAMASIAQLGLTPTTTSNTYTAAASVPAQPLGAPVMMQKPPAHIASAAEAALNEALGLPVSATPVNSSTDGTKTPQAPENVETALKDTKLDAKEIIGSPTLNLLVHNMFDKDEETDEGWQNDIREDFEEECAKYGKITKCVVMHLEPGGKIYSAFDTEISAKNCALALAGRWFDKRQLRVEYVKDEDFPKVALES